MELAVYTLGATTLLLMGLYWLMTRIDYRIGSRDIKVLLAGIPIRRIPLASVKSAHKREPRGWAERWPSTFKPSHRRLTIERTRGLRRYITITPRNRYVFLTDLRNAVRRVNPDNEWASKAVPDEGSFTFTPGESEAAPEQAPAKSHS